MMKRVLLIGGTGLVGGLVRAHLGGRSDVALTSLVRQTGHAGGQVIDFSTLLARPQETIHAIVPDGIDVAISCLGTTIEKAGSREAMWMVDHDYVEAFAKGARAAGAPHFILMSSAGAGGAGFYLKTKAAIEQAVTTLGFPRTDLIRPGLLLGDRPERRIGERLGQILLPALRPLFRGPLSQYQAIPAAIVAGAIIRLIGLDTPGIHIHRNDGIRTLEGH